MTQRVQLPSFVVGPEPDGRGSGILAQSGLPGAAGWQGGLPLVLLEWAKLRSAEGFCGRFAVAGGAIAIRAAYFGEGAAGPIARAYGVFIDDEWLPAIIDCERSLFAAIPAPTQSDAFGDQPLDVILTPNVAGAGWNNFGLAWQDQHIVAAAPQSLEHIALDALAAIRPSGQRGRITGWCTTAQLAARGDFLPIQRCNLLVTRPDEPTVHERFMPSQFASGMVINASPAEPPAPYQFWMRLTDMVGEQPGPLRDAMAWHAQMADWTDEELGWRFIEILSQHKAEYSTIVAAILAISDIDAPARQSAAAGITRNYLVAVAGHDRSQLPQLIALFRNLGGAKRPAIAAALDESIVDLMDDALLASVDDDALLRVIALLRQRADAGAMDGLREKLGMVDDQSVWRALGRNIRAQGSGEGQRRVHLNALWQRMGFASGSAAMDVHKLFLRRKIVGHMLNDQGA